MTYRAAVDDFLAQTHIAVAGVSREGSLPANAIFRRLRDAGYDVVPVNPQAVRVEGVRCYPSLPAVPGPLEAVMIATPPASAFRIVEDAHQRGITRVWMHRAWGAGSVDDTAVHRARELGMTVIPGGCPMMFVEPVDRFHAGLRWTRRVTGTEPVVDAVRVAAGPAPAPQSEGGPA